MLFSFCSLYVKITVHCIHRPTIVYVISSHFPLHHTQQQQIYLSCWHNSCTSNLFPSLSEYSALILSECPSCTRIYFHSTYMCHPKNSVLWNIFMQYHVVRCLCFDFSFVRHALWVVARRVHRIHRIRVPWSFDCASRELFVSSSFNRDAKGDGCIKYTSAVTKGAGSEICSYLKF